MSAGHFSKPPAAWKGALLAAAFALLLPSLGCTSLREHMAMKDAAKAYKQGDFNTAAAKWQEALAHNPRRSDNWKNLGFCYWMLIEPGSKQEKDKVLTNQALEAFQKYLDLVGKDDTIQDYIINLYINQERLDEGIKYYEVMLRQDPNNPLILQTLGVMYARAGNFEKSLEYSEKKANLRPDEATGYLYISALCWQRAYNKQDPDAYRQKLVDRGMGAIDKALSIDGMSFEAHLYKNLLYRQMQDLTKTAAEAEKDRRKKKELLDKADEYLKLANGERDRALEIRKAKQSGTAAAPPSSN